MYSNYGKLFQSCNGSLATETSSTRYLIPQYDGYKKPYFTPLNNDMDIAGQSYLNLLPTNPPQFFPYDALRKHSENEGGIIPLLVNIEQKENFISKKEEGKVRDFALIEFAKKNKDVETCELDDNGKSVCGNGNLFPVLDPRFNLREVAKHLILLEDHLFHQGKRCKDCILKHLLTIEAFLEEAITLDKKQEYVKLTNNSLDEFRKIFKKISTKIEDDKLTDEDCCNLAQELRIIRKPIHQKFACFV
jgi:hypothetical protein